MPFCFGSLVLFPPLLFTSFFACRAFFEMVVRRAATFAKMDIVNKAICYAMRNPPKGTKKTKYIDIAKLVKKTDGRHPTIGAVAIASMVALV
jgi:hypothetical protein